MGKLAVYKYVSFMFLVLTVLMSIFTFVGLFGGDSNPNSSLLSAMLVYALPIFILGDLILLIFWLIRRKWHWAAIPFITILCCIPYIRTIWQPGLLVSSDDNNTSGLTIATYNVALFGRETTGFKSEDILSEMKRHSVDILCMQEYSEKSGDKNNTLSYQEYFPYFQKGKDDMIIFSRYPITNSKNMPFEKTNNSAMWADINVKGHDIRVYNAHLETTGINRTLYRAGKMEMRGQSVSRNKVIEALYGNYLVGMIARAGQANMLAMDMRKSDKPLIVCGDFNDVPYSYVYNTMKGDLVDGFKECGSGWMYTFRGGKKNVRIDYILHDESMKGITYFKSDINYSDHYPVFMKLAF